jgi:hypothetical protein
MSALGQKRTLRRVCVMSALLPKADIDRGCRDVRFVPKADILRCEKNVVIRCPLDIERPKDRLLFTVGEIRFTRPLMPGVGRSRYADMGRA